MAEPDLKKAIRAALQNGDRLVEDANWLLDFERSPAAFALALLAQEEYAKSLLLGLIEAKAIPWSDSVRRALHDHICKQLIAVILDYLAPDHDEFLRRLELMRQKAPIFPSNVLDAIHVICHERIPRERDRWWLDPSERPLDGTVKSIADGRLEGQKQDATYVRIGKNGEVLSLPSELTQAAARAEVERSERIGKQLRPYDREVGLRDDLDSEKLSAVFGLLTGRIMPEAFEAYWWAK